MGKMALMKGGALTCMKINSINFRNTIKILSGALQLCLHNPIALKKAKLYAVLASLSAVEMKRQQVSTSGS